MPRRAPRGHPSTAAAALLLLALVAGGCGDDAPYVPAGIVRTPAPFVGDASLPDVSADGSDFAFRAEHGGLLLVYFGYTSCPDICPTTMADLRSALRELGDEADRFEVGMATIDPDRDTDDVITAYVTTFFPDGHAWRTDDAELLRGAADAFGADYEVSVNDEGYVEVVHTAWVYVVDDEGSLLLQWPFGVESADMALDMKALLEGMAT